jgi:hypothetical protein
MSVEMCGGAQKKGKNRLHTFAMIELMVDEIGLRHPENTLYQYLFSPPTHSFLTLLGSLERAPLCAHSLLILLSSRTHF